MHLTIDFREQIWLMQSNTGVLMFLKESLQNENHQDNQTRTTNANFSSKQCSICEWSYSLCPWSHNINDILLCFAGRSRESSKSITMKQPMWVDTLPSWYILNYVLLLFLSVRHWRAYTKGTACTRCLPTANPTFHTFLFDCLNCKILCSHM